MKKKKLQSIAIAMLFTASAFAQNQHVIWTENFNTSCAVGCFPSPNGAWTVASAGTEGTKANKWYVSQSEVGVLPTNCSGVPMNNPNSTQGTLHIGATSLSDLTSALSSVGLLSLGSLFSSIEQDQGGAQYYPGVNGAVINLLALLLGGGQINATTNTRVESPFIDLTGRQNVTLTFNYIEGGDGSKDNALLYYYDGVNWNLWADLAKTTVCNTNKSTWTSYSIPLPSVANNNPNFKIGFVWVNDNDATGGNISFAVDDIVLSVTEVDAQMSHSGNQVCGNVNFQLQDQSFGDITQWLWTVSGATNASFSTAQPAPFVLNLGTNYIRLDITNGFESDSVIDTVEVFSAPTATFTATPEYSNGTLGTAVVVASGGTAPYFYSWNTSPVQTTDSAINLTQGTYTVIITDANGCETQLDVDINWVDGAPGDDDDDNDTLSVHNYDNMIKVFPNPTVDVLNIVSEALEISSLNVYSLVGTKIMAFYKLYANFQISFGDLDSGVYFVHIQISNGDKVVYKIIKN